MPLDTGSRGQPFTRSLDLVPPGLVGLVFSASIVGDASYSLRTPWHVGCRVSFLPRTPLIRVPVSCTPFQLIFHLTQAICEKDVESRGSHVSSLSSALPELGARFFGIFDSYMELPFRSTDLRVAQARGPFQ